jgi:hypothetical protein
MTSRLRAHGRPAGLRTHLIVHLVYFQEHRVYLTVEAQIPVDGSERVIALLETQPGLQSVRVTSL